MSVKSNPNPRASGLGFMMKRGLNLLLLVCVTLASLSTSGCSIFRPRKVEYGRELGIYMPRGGPRTIAVAPAINLSGTPGVDPLVVADQVYAQVGQVRGVTVVPVNRVAEVLVALGLRQIETAQQAEAVCDQLGVEALIVPTVTLWVPYDPPKMGASLSMFSSASLQASGSRMDIRELVRSATPGPMESLPGRADFLQAAGVFDASAGSVRDRIASYATGRTDPLGPLGVREITLSTEAYSAFVWHELLGELLLQVR